jgi:site-specific recombinase XerD
MNKLMKLDGLHLGDEAELVVRNLVEFRDDVLGQKNANTRKAYLCDFGLFQRFCDKHNYSSFDNNLERTKNMFKHYLEHLIESGLRKTTIKRKLSAISYFYGIAGLANPMNTSKVFKEMIVNKLNKIDGAQNQANAFTLMDLDEFNKKLDFSSIKLRDLRNAAIVNLAFDTLLRASNIIDLTVDDLRFGENLVYVRRGKTDQEGTGSYRYISDFTEKICKEWLGRAEITKDYVFRNMRKSGLHIGEQLSYKGLLKIFKQVGFQVGKSITCHSTRVGAAVALYENGENEIEIMRNGGWKDIKMVDRYTQAAKMKTSAMSKLRQKISY